MASIIEAKDRLILALDVDSEEEAKRIVKELDGIISFFKVGIELQVVAGTAFINWLKEEGKKVFLDLKYHDVPDTVERAVRRVSSLGVDFLTVHGSNGDILSAAEKGKGTSDLRLIAVTVLTTLDVDDLRDLGYKNHSVLDVVMHRAMAAHKNGCSGVIASAMEVSTIKSGFSEDLLVITPGIRLDDEYKNGHKRFGHPRQAILDGADFIVVGRPIRNAHDIRSKAEEYVSEIESALLDISSKAVA